MDRCGSTIWNHLRVQGYSDQLMKKKGEEKWKLGNEKLVVGMICHDNCVQVWKMLKALGK